MLQIFYISALIASIAGGLSGYYSDRSTPAKDPSSAEVINSYEVIKSYKVAENFSTSDITKSAIPHPLDKRMVSQGNSINLN